MYGILESLIIMGGSTGKEDH